MKIAVVCLVNCMLLGCAAEGSKSADNSPDANAGRGGTLVVDGSFGGTAGTGGASGGASGGGAGGAGGDAGPADTGADAPLLCDTSGGLDCSPAAPSSYQCGDAAPTLAGKVKAAIKAVLTQHPEWFNFTVGAPCCPLALQPQAFRDAVVSAINSSGACATVDPNNPNIELVVKTNNKCSEQFVILTSANIVRNPAKHQGSCVPAWL